MIFKIIKCSSEEIRKGMSQNNTENEKNKNR